MANSNGLFTKCFGGQVHQVLYLCSEEPRGTWGRFPGMDRVLFISKLEPYMLKTYLRNKTMQTFLKYSLPWLEQAGRRNYRIIEALNYDMLHFIINRLIKLGDQLRRWWWVQVGGGGPQNKRSSFFMLPEFCSFDGYPCS